MGWYLRDQKTTSVSLTDDQAGRAICDYFRQVSAAAYGPEAFLPTWHNLLQAALMALMASFCGYHLMRSGVDALFTFRHLYAGLAFFVASVLLALVAFCWGWGGIWRFASRRKYWYSVRQVQVIKTVAVLGLLATQGFTLVHNRAGFQQLPTWFQTFDNKTRFLMTKDKTVLVLEGVIGRETPKRLSAWLQKTPSIQTVSLNLQGGLVEEARQMNQIIDSYALNTEVLQECSSACTIVFMAGRGRRVGPGAKIGFHRYHYVRQEESRQADLVEQAYLVSLGIPSEFVAKALAADDVWYPSMAELYQANIVTADEVQSRLNEKGRQ